MTHAPTPRQRELMLVVQTHWERWKWGPSLREIAEDMRITSSAGVSQHVEKLVDKGLVTKEPFLSRTLRLTAAGKRALARRK